MGVAQYPGGQARQIGGELNCRDLAPGHPLTRGRFNVIAVIRTPNTANTLALRSSRDLGFRRPVRPGACIGLGTDRTMSITALRCEGSHISGGVGDGARMAPKGHKTGSRWGAHRSRSGEVVEWRRRR